MRKLLPNIYNCNSNPKYQQQNYNNCRNKKVGCIYLSHAFIFFSYMSAVQVNSPSRFKGAFDDQHKLDVWGHKMHSDNARNKFLYDNSFWFAADCKTKQKTKQKNERKEESSKGTF